MSINSIPRVLYRNKIAAILDEVRDNYGKLTRKGYVYGLIAVDQDAKIIAIDSRFDRSLNYWDLSSIGVALYGVSRQGQDFFDAHYLDRASIIYNNLQLFVRSIGHVNIHKKGKREILIILLANKDVNIGVIILQMSHFGKKIKDEIEKSRDLKNLLKLSEMELKQHIMKLKKEIFSQKISNTSS